MSSSNKAGKRQNNKPGKRITASPCLGIMDWGIGGMGFLRLWRQNHPDIAAIYFSDTGMPPYGKLSQKQLVARMISVMKFLHNRGVTHLVVACNAMSTILPHLTPVSSPSIQITGVIEPTIKNLKKTDFHSYGIVGGRRTVLSRAYANRLRVVGKKVRQRVAQPLSAFIEAGELDSSALKNTLTEILRPLANVEILILACTHYPVIIDQFRYYLPNAVIVDPAEMTLAWIEKKWNGPATRGPIKFITTGSVSAMKTAAQKAFGIRINEIEKANVNLT